MLHYKLGDVLDYIPTELKEYKQKKKLVHYCSAAVYMYLHDLITAETVVRLQKLYMTIVCGKRRNSRIVGEEFKEIIIYDRNFEEIISSKTITECIELLNSYKIEEWIVSQAKTLILLLPKARLENEYLYYYEESNNESDLYRIYLPEVNGEYSLFRFSTLVFTEE